MDPESRALFEAARLHAMRQLKLRTDAETLDGVPPFGVPGPGMYLVLGPHARHTCVTGECAHVFNE